MSIGVTVRLAFEVRLDVGSQIARIDVCLLTLARAVALLDKGLVCAKRGLEFINGDVVEEDAFAECSVGNGESLLAVAGFPAGGQ